MDDNLIYLCNNGQNTLSVVPYNGRFLISVLDAHTIVTKEDAALAVSGAWHLGFNIDLWIETGLDDVEFILNHLAGTPNYPY